MGIDRVEQVGEDVYIIFEDGTRRRRGEIRSYPLYEIREGHFLYEMLPSIIENQFGVEGGIEGLTEHINEWWADEQIRQQQERLQQRRGPLWLRRTVTVMMAGAAIYLFIKGLSEKREPVVYSNNNSSSNGLRRGQDMAGQYNLPFDENKTRYDFRFTSRKGDVGVGMFLLSMVLLAVVEFLPTAEPFAAIGAYVAIALFVVSMIVMLLTQNVKGYGKFSFNHAELSVGSRSYFIEYGNILHIAPEFGYGTAKWVITMKNGERIDVDETRGERKKAYAGQLREFVYALSHKVETCTGQIVLDYQPKIPINEVRNNQTPIVDGIIEIKYRRDVYFPRMMLCLFAILGFTVLIVLLQNVQYALQDALLIAIIPGFVTSFMFFLQYLGMSRAKYVSISLDFDGGILRHQTLFIRPAIASVAANIERESRVKIKK